MKILFVCHRFPFPPTSGYTIRPFNIIQHLSQSHEVTVASLVRSEEEAAEGEGIREYCEKYIMPRVNPLAAKFRMVARLLTLAPSSMGYFYSPQLASDIQDELAREKYDLIFVHCSSVAQYVADIKDSVKILDFCDMDSQKWLQYSKFKKFPLSLGYWLEGSKMERAERVLAKKFDLCTCNTRAELDTLDGYNTAHATDWFPNGVDLDYFAYASEPYQPDSVCFIGRMDYYPNQQCMIDFCSRVWPQVLAQRPAATLLIIGAAPSKEVCDLARQQGVEVTGTVDDVRPHVMRCAVNVAPLIIARGTQNKILESMAMGVPVVCSEVAAAGVDAIPGEHLLTASTAEQYTQAIVSMLADTEKRQQFSRAGRERVADRHAWANSMLRLNDMIEKL